MTFANASPQFKGSYATEPVMQPAQPWDTPEIQQNAALLAEVPEYLSRGQELLRWWREMERTGGPREKFRLERSFNRATRSFGFYGEAPVGGDMMPVMGNVQEMFYDQPRAPASHNLASAHWMATQMREFALKYWMRISSFRQPEARADDSQPVPPPALAPLSWCPKPRPSRVGFGFSQLFYKPVGMNEVRAFPTYDQQAIVDQRLVGKLYEWLLLKVRIFDFNFRTRPFGENGPELVAALNEESNLIVHQDFINDKERPLPGVLGDFGIGYSFVKSPVPGPFGYGPGEFDAALELINFRVYETGYVSVRMIFVSNRPTKVTNVVVDPLRWGLQIADLFSFGLASWILAPARAVLEPLPLRFTVDPVLGYVNLANALTANYAARNLCISLEQLEKNFLVQHFRQHYETVLGSLATWRRFPDWLDEQSLPPWVTSGVGS
jgi:hypothetical protein